MEDEEELVIEDEGVIDGVGDAVSDSQRAPPTPLIATVATVPPSSGSLWKPHVPAPSPIISALVLPIA